MAKKRDELALIWPFEAERLADVNLQPYEAMLKCAGIWVRGADRMQREALEFFDRRINEDMELSVRIAECDDPGEVLDQQAAFVQKMVKDYADEYMRLFDVACRTANAMAGKAAADNKDLAA